jgi:branched-chain amino acid transport system substrate-binding protein
MNKKISIGIMVAILLIGGYMLLPQNKSQEKEIIKIGYITPLSGNVAFLGQGIKNAAELALTDLNKKSTRYQYQLIFEDDAFDPKRSVTAAAKLINIDKVDVLVSVASSAGSVVAPIAETNRIVHFGIAGDPNVAKGEYNFINWTPPAEEVKTFVSEAQKRGIKRIALFSQSISGFAAVTSELKKQLVGTGIELVFEDISNFGTKDFRTAVAKAKATAPDYYLLNMFSPELEIVMGQIQAAGIKTPVTAIESFELSDNPGIFEGLWYVNGADPTESFASEYLRVFSKSPSIATPNAYDIVGIVASAVESFKNGKPSTTELAQALVKTRGYNGALGNNLEINNDGFVISKAVVRQIKDGKPVTVGK